MAALVGWSCQASTSSEAMLQVLGTDPGPGVGTQAYRLIGKTLVNTIE